MVTPFRSAGGLLDHHGLAEYRRPGIGGVAQHAPDHRPARRCLPVLVTAALPSPQVVLSRGSTGTTAASDARPASGPLPGSAGYRTPRSGDNSAGHRAGEGLPSSRRHPRDVPRPIRRQFPHGCASRLFAASMAFAPISRGSALPYPPSRAAE